MKKFFLAVLAVVAAISAGAQSRFYCAQYICHDQKLGDIFEFEKDGRAVWGYAQVADKDRWQFAGDTIMVFYKKVRGEIVFVNPQEPNAETFVAKFPASKVSVSPEEYDEGRDMYRLYVSPPSLSAEEAAEQKCLRWER